MVELRVGERKVGVAKEKSCDAAHVFLCVYGKKKRVHATHQENLCGENKLSLSIMSDKPAKTPMKTNEFYSCYDRKRVACDMSNVTVKELVRETKTGKTTTRYQAVGLDDQGRKLYKFIGKKDLGLYQ